MRRLRIMVGIVILMLSLALLIWGLLPPRHEVRTQPISPTQLQLPTPTSLRWDMASPPLGAGSAALGAALPQLIPVL